METGTLCSPGHLGVQEMAVGQLLGHLCRADIRSGEITLPLAGATLALPEQSQRCGQSSSHLTDPLAPGTSACGRRLNERPPPGFSASSTQLCAAAGRTRASCCRTSSRRSTAFVLGGRVEFPAAGPVPESGPATSPGVMCPGWGSIAADPLPHVSDEMDFTDPSAT